MIYTVTFNPSLDYIVSVPNFELGKTNRTVYEQMLAGGKGINVTTVLRNLGIDSTALGFVAGFTGDELIRNACRLICDTFKHSPVFRIGGDEFAVVLNGQDYEHRTMLCELLRDKAVFRMKNRSGAVVACGIATFDAHKDHGVADVFKRADDLMYKNKKALKTNA